MAENRKLVRRCINEFSQCYFTQTHLHIWVVLWICTDMLFFSRSVCNTGAMIDKTRENNSSRVRLGRGSQTVLVRREKSIKFATPRFCFS